MLIIKIMYFRIYKNVYFFNYEILKDYVYISGIGDISYYEEEL